MVRVFITADTVRGKTLAFKEQKHKTKRKLRYILPGICIKPLPFPPSFESNADIGKSDGLVYV